MKKDMKHKIITTDTIRELYKNEDERIINFLCDVRDAIEDDISYVPSYFRITFDLLRDELRTYYKCQDQMLTSDIMNAGQHGEDKKNPIFMIGRSSWNSVCKLLSNIGVTPMSKSKIKKLQNSSNYDENAEDLLKDLLN